MCDKLRLAIYYWLYLGMVLALLLLSLRLVEQAAIGHLFFPGGVRLYNE
jgi:hypothetical protein